MPQWFIKRPHAVDQFRLRAGYPESTDSVELETELRRALDTALERPDALLEGCRHSEYAVKLAINGRNVVYAIVKPADSRKTYDYVVPTVVTTGMYQAWAKDGRLGDLSDLPPEKRQLPKIKKTLYLRYENGDGQAHFAEYVYDEIPAQVLRLLEAGVPLRKIKVLEEKQVQLDISLMGFTP